MIVFCAGLRSSASTLQYQIAKHLVESNNLGFGFTRAHNRTLDCFKIKDAKYIVVKTHKLHKKEHDKIANSDAKILMTVRDLRDQLCSLMQRKDYNFDGAFSHMLAYKNEQSEWLEFENKMLTFRYCDFANDIENHVYKIANFLGIPVTQIEALDIANKYSLENNRKRLGPKHITDARVGKYKEMLTKEQIAKIEHGAGNWLKKYGYL
jgi:hypothetical protein